MQGIDTMSPLFPIPLLLTAMVLRFAGKKKEKKGYFCKEIPWNQIDREGRPL
jgi:hypothetical protein